MEIDFSAARWDAVKENSELFFAHKLKRPLIQLRVDSGGWWPEEKPFGGKGIIEALYDLSITPGEIVDHWARNLASTKFLGDSFPAVYANMGPGVVAAYMGARPEPTPSTVWFKPAEAASIREIRLRFDPENVWFKRLEAIYRLAMERWKGRVQVGHTDLGGNLDIVSTFRPSELLLLDLYDSPAEVGRLLWEAHEGWWLAFEEIDRWLQPDNPGYTNWCPIFSVKPYYMLQCDFCYMIGPDMFDEFVRPELAATCRKLGHSFYHLDGIGELPHLDSLLSIKELDGIQWVMGTGKPPAPHWIDAYRRIRDAGKLIHLFCDIPEFAEVVEGLGSAEGIVYTAYDDVSEAEGREFLAKYGVK